MRRLEQGVRESRADQADAAPADRAAPRAPGKRRGRPPRKDAGQLDRDLLRQALDHFLEKGFEATTVNAITRSLGMSKQTVYARYPDKNALFRAALQTGIDEWLAPLKRLHELETDDLEETLVKVAGMLVATMLSSTGLRLIRITNAESFRVPEIGRYTYGKGRALFAEFLSDLFRRRLPASGDHAMDVDELVTAFLNLISGPARLNAWGLDTDPVDIDAFVRKRVRLFLSGALGTSNGV